LLKIRVGINGYGTIGKRVADALTQLPYITLTGIVKTKPDYATYVAINKGYRIYTIRENIGYFREKGLEIGGTIEDLVEDSDLIIDATPGGLGRKYIELYKKYGKPAILQGGEKHEYVEISFSSLCNYEEAIGKKYVRVVSCNTTGLLRVICLFNEEFGVKRVKATIIRRAADPKEDDRGPLNSIKLDPPKIPSHHAVDVKTVIPTLDIDTVALAVPTTLMHIHVVSMKLSTPVNRDRVIDALTRVKRILLVDSSKTGIDSTSKVVEYSRDYGRYRYDIPENIVWIDTLKIDGDELTFIQGVHQESIVIPENVDAVKAVMGVEVDKWKAIRETDDLLKLGVLRLW